mmetsp:Transcript_98952/g.249884  ORF Transcript_98952/g.249884 Transcript_98952/m.249884 type:complete len:80 (-) Transcript_98952:447-686(-)
MYRRTQILQSLLLVGREHGPCQLQLGDAAAAETAASAALHPSAVFLRSLRAAFQQLHMPAPLYLAFQGQGAPVLVSPSA